MVIAIPGPSVMFTLSRALTAGRRTALLNVAGNATGLVGQVFMVAFGLGPVVERSADVFSIVKLAGAAYLIHLGAQAVRRRHALAEAVAKRAGPVPARRAVRDGMVVGALNPRPSR